MTDLIAELRAALDEDERIARDAGGREWGVGSTSSLSWGPHGEQPWGTVILDSEGQWPRPTRDDASHVYEKGDHGSMVFDATIGGQDHQSRVHHAVRHDPARVLRQVAAMRKILDLHELSITKQERDLYDPSTGQPNPVAWNVECSICGWVSENAASACPTLLALAHAYGIQ